MLTKSLRIAATLTFALGSSVALAVPYQVHMDNVLNLANWATMDNGVGDLYDGGGTKQVEISYTERAGFGNTAPSTDVQFWESLEYGDNHKAIFGNSGGVDVIEVEITGLNGHLIDLSQVIVGRWYPDGIDTLGSNWAVYDGDWNLLSDGFTLMTDFVDYFLDFSLGSFETVRFQLGDDNWDNGIIAFTYETDVSDGTLDLNLDRVDNPTPNLPGSGPSSPGTVPEPSAIILLGVGLAGISFARRRKAN